MFRIRCSHWEYSEVCIGTTRGPLPVDGGQMREQAMDGGGICRRTDPRYSKFETSGVHSR